MKHLLTLLLFISTSVMGETTYLICDGIEQTRNNDSVDEIAKSIGIEVSDKYMTYQGIRFPHETIKMSIYEKKQNRIDFSLLEFAGETASRSALGFIDRISGQVYFEDNWFLSHTSIYFDGICKKGKKAF